METRYLPLTKLFIENNYDEIFEYCDILIKTNPEDTFLEELRSFSSIFKNDFDLSYADIQENFEVFNVDLSILDTWLKNNKELESSLSFKLFFYYALSNLDLDKYTEYQFKKLEFEESEAPELYKIAASNEYSSLDKFNECDGALQRLCYEYPNRYEPQFVLGTLYTSASASIHRDSKEFYNESAIECFNNSIKLESGHIPSLVLLCSCYIDVDDHKALRTIEKGILIYPDNPTINYVKAFLLFKTWEYSTSKTILESIIEKSPNTYEAKELVPILIDDINKKSKKRIIIDKIIEKGILILGISIMVYALSSIIVEPYLQGIPRHYYDLNRLIRTGGIIPILIFNAGALIFLGQVIFYSRILRNKKKSELPLLLYLGYGLPLLLGSIFPLFYYILWIAKDLARNNMNIDKNDLWGLVGVFGFSILLFLRWRLLTIKVRPLKIRKERVR